MKGEINQHFTAKMQELHSLNDEEKIPCAYVLNIKIYIIIRIITYLKFFKLPMFDEKKNKYPNDQIMPSRGC